MLSDILINTSDKYMARRDILPLIRERVHRNNNDVASGETADELPFLISRASVFIPLVTLVLQTPEQGGRSFPVTRHATP